MDPNKVSGSLKEDSAGGREVVLVSSKTSMVREPGDLGTRYLVEILEIRNGGM